MLLYVDEFHMKKLNLYFTGKFYPFAKFAAFMFVVLLCFLFTVG